MIPTQSGTDRTLHDKGEKIVVKGYITVESTYGNVQVKRVIHPYTLPIDIAIIDAIEKLVVKML